MKVGLNRTRLGSQKFGGNIPDVEFLGLELILLHDFVSILFYHNLDVINYVHVLVH